MAKPPASEPSNAKTLDNRAGHRNASSGVPVDDGLMSTPARQRAFGRRPRPDFADNGFKLQTLRLHPLARSESGMSLEDLARRMEVGSFAPNGSNRPESADRREIVWSTRAALVAGLATACMTAALLLGQNSTSPEPSDALSQTAALLGIGTKAAAPALLCFSLWSAGASTVTTLAAAHFVLKKVRLASSLAYSTFSAAAGALLALSSQVLGFGGPDHGYLAEMAIGACAGYLYRKLAAASRRPA